MINRSIFWNAVQAVAVVASVIVAVTCAVSQYQAADPERIGRLEQQTIQLQGYVRENALRIRTLEGRLNAQPSPNHHTPGRIGAQAER